MGRSDVSCDWFAVGNLVELKHLHDGRRRDESRIDGIDAYVITCPFAGKDPGEIGNAGFCCTVWSHTRNPIASGHACRIDDCTTVLSKRISKCVSDVERPGEVHFNDTVPIFGIDLVEGAALTSATGIVHENIDTAELFNCSFSECFDRLAVRNVTFDRQNLAWKVCVVQLFCYSVDISLSYVSR